MSGRIGDKVGYRVVQVHANHWVETDCPTLDHISQAVGMIRSYQQADPATTFGVARMELVMISRPDPTQDPEGRALVQAIHDRKHAAELELADDFERNEHT
ncbi:MAG: hypothetical protein M3536_00305 [Actinomycetota bacterium]|nr:hypothetical protein [Actinomycetota bacterium]